MERLNSITRNNRIEKTPQALIPVWTRIPNDALKMIDSKLVEKHGQEVVLQEINCLLEAQKNFFTNKLDNSSYDKVAETEKSISKTLAEEVTEKLERKTSIH